MAKRDPEELRRRKEELQRRRQEQVRRQILIICVAAAVLFALAIFAVTRVLRAPSREESGGAAQTVSTAAVTVSTAAVTAPETTVSSAPETPSPTPTPELVENGYIDAEGVAHFVNDPAYSEKITILGTGDNLIHENVYLDARQEDGSYDFIPMYSRVKPYIQAADIATVNQESPIASSIGEVSGYPAFNTPEEAGDALVDAGFDLINQANNHILDMGEQGAIATLDYWDSKGIPYIGAYRSWDDLSTQRVLEVNGIRVAFVGIVNWTNKEPTGETGFTMIWIDDEESVREAIRRAREAADIVVVYAHWGEENENIITEQMDDMARKMVDWGADIIFGDHTHLVQKITVLQRESDGALCPVQFCGGNFISGQKARINLLSVLTTAEYAKNPETGKVVCTGLQALPLVTHYDGERKNFCIYPLEDYTEELAEANGVKEYDEVMTLDYLWNHINGEIPAQFLAHP